MCQRGITLILKLVNVFSQRKQNISFESKTKNNQIHGWTFPFISIK